MCCFSFLTCRTVFGFVFKLATLYLAPLTPHYPKYAKASDVIPSFLLLLHQSHLCDPSFLLPLYMSDRDQGGGSLEGTLRGRHVHAANMGSRIFSL